MVVKLRTKRVRSPSRRVREANEQASPVVREGPGTRSRGRTPRSRSPVRRASTRDRSRSKGQPVAVSQPTEEPAQADLDDASDSSVNPRLVAAAPGAPNLLELFGMEEEDRAERTVNELESIEDDVEVEVEDRAGNTVQAFPRLPPTPAQVRIRSEDRFDKHVYNAFLVCGATTRVAAFLSREVVTMKGLAELALGGGSNVEKPGRCFLLYLPPLLPHRLRSFPAHSQSVPLYRPLPSQKGLISWVLQGLLLPASDLQRNRTRHLRLAELVLLWSDPPPQVVL